MNQALLTVAISLLLTWPAASLTIARSSQPDDNDEQYDLDAKDANRLTETINMKLQREEEVPQGPALPSPDTHVMSLAGTSWHHHSHLANGTTAKDDSTAAPPVGVVPVKRESVKHAAKQAHEAATVAKQAAVVANKVAEHSIKITGHAKKALKHALGALHDARVDSSGLDHHQKHSLKKAEAHLREATKTADHGDLKKIKDDGDLQKEQMQAELDKRKSVESEKHELVEEIEELREKLKGKKHDKDLAKTLKEMQEEVEVSDGSNSDEVKAELGHLREIVDKLEDKKQVHDKSKSLAKDIGLQPLEDGEHGHDHHNRHDHDEHDDHHHHNHDAVMPIEEKGIDIDTQMPYGDLEPFGREDTAQELTESSIKESDGMVDQLERAEVAEEKRAVFRALTRLRGAAITSYDGVARAQSGNIDEYSKTHKFRKSHPLHHLADEESDVTKWAFPDNADFL